MAATVVDELVTLLGLQLSPNAQANIDKFNKGLEKIEGFAVKASASVTAAASAIMYFAEKATMSASGLDKFAELTGQSVESIQRWSYAVEAAGGSASAVKGDIEHLVRAMNPTRPGDYNQGMMELGMYSQKYVSTSQLILDMFDRIEAKSGGNAGKKLNFIADVGLSPDMVLLMNKTRSDLIRTLASTPMLLDKKQTGAARDFDSELKKVEFTIKQIGEKIAIGISKPVTVLLEKALAWVSISENQEWVERKIKDIVEGISEAFHKVEKFVISVHDWVQKNVPGLHEWVDELTASDVILDGILVSLGLVVAVVVAMTWEWILAGAAISAAVLLIKNYTKGTDDAQASTDALSDSTGSWIDQFTHLHALLDDVWKVMKAIGGFTWDFLTDAFERVSRSLGQVATSFAWLLDLGAKLAGFGNKPGEGSDPIGVISAGTSAWLDSIAAKNKPSAPASGGGNTANLPMNQVSAMNPTSNQISISNTFHIKSTDPKQVAAEVKNNFQDFTVRNLAGTFQ